MELNQYLLILKKNILVIIAVTFLFTSLGFVYSAKSSPNYKITQVFLIDSAFKLSPQPSSAPLSLRSSQEESRDFTDTAVALIESQDFNAQFEPSTVTTQKLAPQLLKITVASSNPDEAATLILRLKDSFNQKIKEIITNQSFEIKPVGSQQVPLLSKIDSKIVISAGFFIGLAFSLLVISIKTYFRL